MPASEVVSGSTMGEGGMVVSIGCVNREVMADCN